MAGYLAMQDSSIDLKASKTEQTTKKIVTAHNDGYTLYTLYTIHYTNFQFVSSPHVKVYNTVPVRYSAKFKLCFGVRIGAGSGIEPQTDSDSGSTKVKTKIFIFTYHDFNFNFQNFGSINGKISKQ